MSSVDRLVKGLPEGVMSTVIYGHVISGFGSLSELAERGQTLGSRGRIVRLGDKEAVSDIVSDIVDNIQIIVATKKRYTSNP